MEYVRIYSGEDGLSHFEDVKVPAEQSVTVTGVTINEWTSMPIGDALRFNEVDPLSPDSANPASEGDGWGPWHPEPRPEFIIRIAGDVEIECSDGEVRTFGPGDVLLVEDVTGKGHRNRRLSNQMRSIFIPIATAPATV